VIFAVFDPLYVYRLQFFYIYIDGLMGLRACGECGDCQWWYVDSDIWQ